MYSACSKPFFALLLFPFIFNFNAFATDHGNSCATATMVNLGSNTPGELTEGDSDFFAVTIPDKGETNIFVIGQTLTNVRLFDSNSIQIDVDAPSFGNASIARELEPGAYCVEVFGRQSTITGLYALQVEGDFASDDHGTDCDSATVINANGPSVSGELSISGDSDFFLFQIPDSGHIRASVTGSTSTNANLFDSNGIQIDSDNSVGNAEITRELEPGSYCLEVFGSLDSTRGLYALQIEGDFANDDHGTSCDSATVVGSSSIPGELTVYDDADYFRIQMPETGGTLTVFATGSNTTVGRLFDESGVLLESDEGALSNFSITRELAGGTYCVEVSGLLDTARGAYALMVEGDFIPATQLPPLCSGQAIYDPITQTLSIPDVRIGDACLYVELQQRTTEAGFVFDVTNALPASR